MMFLTKIKKTLPWLLVILWMALIFYLSHQPATESSDLSAGLTEFIMGIINKILPNAIFGFEGFHHVIRKNAHFFAYLVLGLLVANAMRGYRGRKVLVAVLICVLYAMSDELHQTFIPGRAGQVMDVVIDSAGSVVGVLGYQIPYVLKKR